MFDNKFLKSAKDPLVEAVKGAMQDGDLRRQAIAAVNEAFGVYNRNAVIRENLADYDAAIEEAYKNLKEGNVENIMNPNSNWAKKQAADKNNPFNQPTPDPKDVAPNIMMRGNTQGGSSSMVDKVKSLFKEGKKADKDYDRDGKVESDKAEYQGSRIRAAKEAGKLEELYGKGKVGDIKKHHKIEGDKAWDRAHRVNTQDRADAEMSKSDYHSHQGRRAKELEKKLKEEQIDEISRATLASYKKKANRQIDRIEPRLYTKKEKPDDERKLVNRIAGVNLADKKREVRVAATNEGLDVVKRDPSVQGSGDVTRSPKGYEDPSTPKVPYSELPKPGNRAGGVIDSAKGALKENEKCEKEEKGEKKELNELKQSTLRSYINKASLRMKASRDAGFKKDFTEKKGKKAEKSRGEFEKRGKGLGLAGKKLAEEDQSF